MRIVAKIFENKNKVLNMFLLVLFSKHEIINKKQELTTMQNDSLVIQHNLFKIKFL